MPPSELRAIIRRSAAVLIVCVAVSGVVFAQQSYTQESSLAELHFDSDSSGVETASAPRTSPPEAPQHKFWDRTNRILFAAVALSNTADFAATRNNLQNGGRELNPLTRQFGRSTAGLAVNFAGETVFVVGLSYLFHRTGHHRLERLTSAIDATMSTAAVSYDLTH